MRTLIPCGIIAAIAVLVVLRLTGALGDARAQLEAAQDSAAVLADVAARETARADSAALRARADRARADSARAVADSIGGEVKWLIAQLAPVPPIAIPFTAPRDSIIRRQAEQIAALDAALDAKERETAELRAARAADRIAIAQLRAGIAVLNEAIDAAQGKWYEPTVGLGAGAGVCADLKPCVLAAGVTVQWHIDLPWLF